MRILKRITATAVSAFIIFTGGYGISLPATALSNIPKAPMPSVGELPSTAMDRFGACVAGQQKGDILFVVDESSSLQRTDPSNARVTAAKYLVNQLARFATDAKVELSIRIDGFSTRYAPGEDWAALTNVSASAATARIDAFAGRNTGEGTDYWLALDGGRRTLVEHAKEQKLCQALVFVTDGGLYVGRASDEDSNKIDRPYDPANTVETEDQRLQAGQKAEEDICRAGGIADQIRGSNIAMLGIGLTTPETASDDTFDLMRKIVEGKTPKGTCGSKLEPTPGDFLLADNIDQLLLIFDRYRNPGNKPVQQSVSICQGTVCPEGAHRFVLDASISQAEVLATAAANGTKVFLITPDGRQHELPAAGENIPIPDGIPGHISWQTERTLSIVMDREKSLNWAGPWQVVFVDPNKNSAGQQSQSSILIKGDLKPVIAEISLPDVQTKKKVPVTLGLADSTGKHVDASKLAGTVQMDADLISSTGETISLAKGIAKEQLATPLVMDLTDAKPGDYALRTTLNLTTAAWQDPAGQSIPGTKLAPITVSTLVPVLPPPDYPVLEQQVNFGMAEGPADLTASVKATGPGCVWLSAAPAPETSPKGIEEATVTSKHNSEESCLKIDKGATVEFPVTFTTKNAGNGGVTGVFTMTMKPSGSKGEALTADISYLADLHQKLNATKFWAVFLVAGLLGPLLPIGILYLLKYLIASKFPDEAMIPALIPVTFEQGQIFRDGKPFAFQPEDKTNMISPKGRSQQVGPYLLKAVMGASPFGAGYALVVPTMEGIIGASDAYPDPATKKRIPKLPLAVQNHWALLLDPSAPANTAQVLFIFAGTTNNDQQRLILQDFMSNAPRIFESLKTSIKATSESSTQLGSANFPNEGAPSFPRGNETTNSVPTFPGMPSSVDPMGSGLPTIPNAAAFPGAQEPINIPSVDQPAMPQAPENGPSFPTFPGQ
ncbi:MAG: vWA domain-containing protein [Propionibacteriaceae bacterium]